MKRHPTIHQRCAITTVLIRPNEVCQDIAGQEVCVCADGLPTVRGPVSRRPTCGGNNEVSDAGTTPPTDNEDADFILLILTRRWYPASMHRWRSHLPRTMFISDTAGNDYEFVELCMDDCVNGACTSLWCSNG